MFYSARAAAAPSTALAALDDGTLERRRLHGDVFGKEARQRDTRAGLGVQPQRRERLLRQQAAARGDGKQTQIGRRAGQRLIDVFFQIGQHPVRRPRQAVERFFKPHARPAERRIVGGIHRLDDAAQFGEIALDRLAAKKRQLAGDEIDRLNAVGALVDRGDARVAIKLRRTGFLDEAHAAMHLHAERGYFDADIARKRFGEWREQRSARMRRPRAPPCRCRARRDRAPARSRSRCCARPASGRAWSSACA